MSDGGFGNALIVMGAGALAREFMALLVDRHIWHIVCVGKADIALPRGVAEVGTLIYAMEYVRAHNAVVCGAVCVGQPQLRAKLRDELRAGGVADCARLRWLFGKRYGEPMRGNGSIVFPDTTLAVGTVIGDNVFVNFNCVIGHDTVVGDSSVIAPGVHIGGHSVIGKRVFIGIGACLRDHITIGDDAVIGAGAAVVTNIPANVVVTGVPAKVNRLLTELRQEKRNAVY